MAVNYLQALFRKISKKMKKKFSIEWVHPQGELNPGLWVDRQISNPLRYEQGGGTGEAGEATASLEFRAFTTDKF